MCALVNAGSEDAGGVSWPPILGLFDAIVVTLTYLRRNRVQAELAEAFGVSQSTISRAVTALTPVLGRMLIDYVPVAEDLDVHTQLIVDGTLLPCWSWHGQRQLYSGKHTAPRRRPVVYPTQSGGIGGIFLGLMPNLAPKGQGNNSMAENQCSCPGVGNEALGDPRDTVKAELLDTLISSGESPAPTGKTHETGAIPCVVVLC
ncbi:MAG: transposase family protein [Pseudonocardiaceae bacterium]